MGRANLLRFRAALLATTLLLASTASGGDELDGLESSYLVLPERATYNVGETVRLRLVSPHVGKSSPPGKAHFLRPLELTVNILYAGEWETVVKGVRLSFLTTRALHSQEPHYQEIWQVPAAARTGRYEVDLIAHHAMTREHVFTRRGAASFAVHRKLVRVDRIELDKPFYASGERVGVRATLENLSGETVEGLLIQFADRHWPWIAPPPGVEPPKAVTLAENVSLAAGERRELEARRALAARAVKGPSFHQFAVIVRDRDRRHIFDISFSPPVILHPPGSETPRPYPDQYLFPRLDAVNTDAYRSFIPPDARFAAIDFDRTRTMFKPGDEAAIRVKVQNLTETPWRKATVRTSLRALGSASLGEQTLAEAVDLIPQAAPREFEVRFRLPEDGGGLYRIVVDVRNAAEETLASSQLEIAANPLLGSILIFCAHQDDETLHSGTIRAAVENNVPVRVVYFTSGDAGSCDRYYQRSCSPAEALHFGALRMDEARASLAHLGVLAENIFFLGLPDGGSGEIWYRHRESVQPYLSVLLASDHAPYEGLVRPNLPYARESVIAVVKELLRKFRPEAVITAHPPSQGHIDHIVNGYFVIRALRELAREDPAWRETKVFVDRVYDDAAAPPTPYRYQEHVLHLTGDVSARAQEASWFYQSQGGNRGLGRIRPFDQLPRTQTYRQVLDWTEHEGWNEED